MSRHQASSVKSPTREVNGLCGLDEAGMVGGGAKPAETRGWGGAGVRVSVAGTVFRGAGPVTAEVKSRGWRERGVSP